MTAEAKRIFGYGSTGDRTEIGPRQEAFVAALESGDYNQGADLLCERKSCGGLYYCALGVAASSARKSGAKFRVGFRDDELYIDGKCHYLTGPVRGFLGLSIKGADFIVAYNDTNELTFPQIAAAIRNAPSKYFDQVK